MNQGSSLWGRAFEHNIILECVRLNQYLKRDAKFSHLKPKDGAEIDIIIELPKKPPLCVEIKSARTISDVEVSKLKKITKAIDRGVPMIVFDGEPEMNILGVRVLPCDTCKHSPLVAFSCKKRGVCTMKC